MLWLIAAQQTLVCAALPLLSANMEVNLIATAEQAVLYAILP